MTENRDFYTPPKTFIFAAVLLLQQAVASVFSIHRRSRPNTAKPPKRSELGLRLYKIPNIERQFPDINHIQVPKAVDATCSPRLKITS